ncbi:MAG: branched-chain amino acid transaminase [Chloroflexi bacterium]|nr:branched-chain amino acid transaminase [Chloroflexota bacterium]
MAGKAKYAWIDGEFVPWDEARVHVSTQTVLRGANVFEGVRAYWKAGDEELYVFKLPEHMRRLEQSMKVLRIRLPYGVDTIAEASVELLRRCEYREDIHFRPTVYVGQAAPGDDFGVTEKTFFGAFIIAVPRPQKEDLKTGLHVGVSSWQRISDHAMPPRVKAGANYLNSRFAAAQATADGYDSAIMLNERGKVSETPGSCVMLVRDGQVITPSVTDNILESITRATLIQLFKDELGLEVVQRDVDRTELYIADEIFECGSGHEVTPIVSVDRYPVAAGTPGSITRQIQEIYFKIVRGEMPKYNQWLRPTYAKSQQPIPA